MQFQLEVGDWGRDGHNMSASITYEANVSDLGVLSRAHDAGMTMLGFNKGYYYQFVGAGYEDRTLPLNFAAALIAAGILPMYDTFKDLDLDYVEPMRSQVDTYYAEDGSYVFESPEGYANLWMEIAQLGNPDFVFFKTDVPTLHVGGYGLFYT